MPGKGKIYKLADPKKAGDQAVLEVKQILAAGMSKRSLAELQSLLEHADMRVRMEAQFALVDRGATVELTAAAAWGSHGNHPLARVHAIWGLGMLSRKNPGDIAIRRALTALVTDEDTEVSCQAVKVLGEVRHPESVDAIIQQLRAEAPRRRFFAALALGRLGNAEAIGPVVAMLRDNADRDPYLRHAGVMALVGCADRQSLGSLAEDPSPSVRLAVLLAMRRLGLADAARFLNDSEPLLVVEAARAIYDQPLEKAMPQLAALIERGAMPDPLARRVINANYRLKDKANAAALARFAGRPAVSEAQRIEALDSLRTWSQPCALDRVVGLYRPLAARPMSEAADGMRVELGAIFAGPEAVRAEAVKVAVNFGLAQVGAELLDIAADTNRDGAARADAISALAALKDGRGDSKLIDAKKLALTDADPLVRTAGRRLLLQLDPNGVIHELKKALESGETIDRQGALALLAGLKQPAADELLELWLDRLLGKQVPREVQLDLLEAAARHPTRAIVEKIGKFEASRSPSDHLARWTETLYGGDAERGKRIFAKDRGEIGCLECHKVKGTGGDVGPDLTGIGSRQPREYLLESIVMPDKQIAKGYETAMLTLVDGKTKVGILKSEDKNEVRLMTHHGTVASVPVEIIDFRSSGPSMMPANFADYLTRRELRDLVEYLASLK
jgi:quinoprotein glucose dehydrogenase